MVPVGSYPVRQYFLAKCRMCGWHRKYPYYYRYPRQEGIALGKAQIDHKKKTLGCKGEIVLETS